jgi:hypothetical protein
VKNERIVEKTGMILKNEAETDQNCVFYGLSAVVLRCFAVVKAKRKNNEKKEDKIKKMP